MNPAAVKPDFCDWWTDERINEAVAGWKQVRHWEGFADLIRPVMTEFELKSIVELGCGAGFLGQALHNEYVYDGIDGSKTMIEKAEQLHPDIALTCGNLRDLDWLSERDLVCSFAVLKHFSLDDWPVIFNTMLSKGRYAVINVQVTSGPSTDDGDEYHHIWINEDELNHAIEIAGHTLIRTVDRKKPAQLAYSEYTIVTKGF